MIRIFTIYLGLTLLFFSCEKPEKVSNVPELEFRKVSFAPGIDNAELGNYVLVTELELWLRDGDGNIYSLTGDTITPGIYIEYLYKEDTNYYAFDVDDSLSYYKIQHDPDDQRYQRIFEKQGLNKTLEGTLIIDLYFSEQDVEKYDTIKMEVYLKDREENESNVISTPDLPFQMEEFSTEKE